MSLPVRLPKLSSTALTSYIFLGLLVLFLPRFACAAPIILFEDVQLKGVRTTKENVTNIGKVPTSFPLWNNISLICVTLCELNVGIKSRFSVGDSMACVNLVGKLDDFYSSVDTMGVCFLLCEHVNCRGKCEQVRGILSDLSKVGLNDRVSSVRRCTKSEEDHKPTHNLKELQLI